MPHPPLIFLKPELRASPVSSPRRELLIDPESVDQKQLAQRSPLEGVIDDCLTAMRRELVTGIARLDLPRAKTVQIAANPVRHSGCSTESTPLVCASSCSSGMRPAFRASYYRAHSKAELRNKEIIKKVIRAATKDFEQFNTRQSRETVVSTVGPPTLLPASPKMFSRGSIWQSPFGSFARTWSQPNGTASQIATRAGAPSIDIVIQNAVRLQKRDRISQQETARSRTIVRVLRSPAVEHMFDSCVAVLIMLNVVQIGISCDLERTWKGWVVFDTFFAGAFTTEFLYKVWVHGLRGHLCGKMRLWSAFDIFIVSIAILELVLNISVGDQAKMGGFTVFRIVRLCRLTRIMKVLRLPVFKDLLAMIDGLIYGTRTLFWSMCLLVTPIYAVAIIMREMIGTRDDVQHLHYAKPFKSLSWSFFTCFRCIMGDCNTDNGSPIIVHLTDEFGWSYGVGFSLLIAITTFGLFNVIIAIYVDNIQSAVHKREAELRQVRLSDEDLYHRLMGELVQILVHAAEIFNHEDKSIPLDQSGSSSSRPSLQHMCAKDAADLELSREIFMAAVNTDEVQQIFDKLDITPENRVNLFEALDADGGGTLSLAEILNGLTMLRGEPRRADTIANGLMLRQIQARQERDTLDLSEKVAEQKKVMDLLGSELRFFSQEMRRKSSAEDPARH